MEKTSLTNILKEANKIKLFEEIKASKDFDLLVDILDTTLTAINKQKEVIDTQKENLETNIEALDSKLEEKIKNIELKKGDRGEKPVAGVDFPLPKDGEDYVLTEQDKKEIASKITVPIVEKIIEKTEVIKEQPIVTNQITNEIKEVAVSDTGLEIVEKINELPTDEDKYLIDIEHIDGLIKELKELRQLVTTTTYVGGGSGGGRIVKSWDLSPSLNGVLKTFSLPAFWRVISVHTGGSTPTTMRETVDYTTDAGLSTITFTSEISESTTLATGQTIVVIYSE